MKKFVALFLSLVLILSVAIVPASAAGAKNPIKIGATNDSDDLFLQCSTKAQVIPLNVTRAGNAKVTYAVTDSRIKISKTGKLTIPAKYCDTFVVEILTAKTSKYRETARYINVNVFTDSVKILKQTSPSAGRAQLSWNVPLGTQGFTLFYEDTSGDSEQKQMHLPKNVTKITLKGLESGKTYHFGISASNGAGFGGITDCYIKIK